MERQQPCRAHATPVQSRAGREPVRPETLFQFMEGMDDGQPHPMHDSPDQKTDIRAVPQPAERHRDDQVQVAVPPAAPAKRDIQVVAEPQGQGDMPAPPEILYVQRKVR